MRNKTSLKWVLIADIALATLCIAIVFFAFSQRSGTTETAAFDIPTQQEVREDGYPVNENGETYGPHIPEWEEPDLILVQDMAGNQGYIRADDLEGAQTLEEAFSYSQKKSIPMYLQDGETVIGEFTLG